MIQSRIRIRGSVKNSSRIRIHMEQLISSSTDLSWRRPQLCSLSLESWLLPLGLPILPRLLLSES